MHVDAHSDTNEEMFGEQPRTAPPSAARSRKGAGAGKVVQIGQRGSGWRGGTTSTGRAVRLCGAGRGPLAPTRTPLMAGDPRTDGRCAGLPGADIDGLDPAFAPGTGTPEVGAVGFAGAGDCARAAAG
ncbi:arginase family protein [Serratia ureilytica]